MADKKISQLTAASLPLAGTEVLPIVQSGATVKLPVSDITAGQSVLGLGTTPYAWSSSGQTAVLQAKPSTGFGSGSWFSFYGSIGMINNAYWNGTNFTRVTANYPTLYLTDQYAGTHKFHIGPTGSANTTFDFADPDVTFTQAGNIKTRAAKGLDFSANTPAAGMTSQLLNWYEEGTWTPTTNGDATGSFSSAAGKYTRTGNIVVATGFIIVDANFTNNKIGGLPFTCTGGFGGTGANFTSAVLPFAGTTPIFATVNGSATTIEFAENNYPTAHLPNTTTLAYKFTVMYMV